MANNCTAGFQKLVKWTPPFSALALGARCPWEDALYSMQGNLLEGMLPAGARVGTVDRHDCIFR